MKADLMRKLRELEQAVGPQASIPLIVVRLVDRPDADVVGLELRFGCPDARRVMREPGEALEAFFDRVEASTPSGQTRVGLALYRDDV